MEWKVAVYCGSGYLHGIAVTYFWQVRNKRTQELEQCMPRTSEHNESTGGKAGKLAQSFASLLLHGPKVTTARLKPSVGVWDS